jgi:hypothetical protein
MRHLILTVTALAVFAFGMTASMAQQPQQMDPSTIRVNPPAQTSPVIQTQPTTPPNLNTSKNPYEGKSYMQAPVPNPKK